MDKARLQLLGRCALAFVIGCILLYTEAWLAGIYAHYYVHSTAFHEDLRPVVFYTREMVFTLLMIWLMPSLFAAWLLALLKPRRWLLYSVLVILPGIIELIWAVVATQGMGGAVYDIIGESAIRIPLVPLFLWLFYATLRRHGAATG